MDSILFWNAVSLEAVKVSHTDPAKREQNGPTLSSRALAIVHLSMYDAYAGIIGGVGFPRYLSPARLTYRLLLFTRRRKSISISS